MENKKRNESCIILDLETNGDPWRGRIIIVGVMDVKSHQVTTFYDESEEILLIQFLKFFNRNRYNHVIGYNINFDRRFLFSKFVKYRLNAGKFFKAATTDVMKIVKDLNNGFSYNRPGRLGEWAELIGKNKFVKTAPVPLLYKEGKITEILEYNRSDLKLTHELWKRIQFVLKEEYNQWTG